MLINPKGYQKWGAIGHRPGLSAGGLTRSARKNFYMAEVDHLKWDEDARCVDTTGRLVKLGEPFSNYLLLRSPSDLHSVALCGPQMLYSKVLKHLSRHPGYSCCPGPKGGRGSSRTPRGTHRTIWQHGTPEGAPAHSSPVSWYQVSILPEAVPT